MRPIVAVSLSLTLWGCASLCGLQRKFADVPRNVFLDESGRLKSPKARAADLANYDFEHQFAIYTYGHQCVEPPIDLDEAFAQRGLDIVATLEDKLKEAVKNHDDSNIRDIVQVFDAMSREGTYDVAGDERLMHLLASSVNAVHDPFWKDFCQRQLDDIAHSRTGGGVPHKAT